MAYVDENGNFKLGNPPRTKKAPAPPSLGKYSSSWDSYSNGGSLNRDLGKYSSYWTDRLDDARRTRSRQSTGVTEGVANSLAGIRERQLQREAERAQQEAQRQQERQAPDEKGFLRRFGENLSEFFTDDREDKGYGNIMDRKTAQRAQQWARQNQRQQPDEEGFLRRFGDDLSEFFTEDHDKKGYGNIMDSATRQRALEAAERNKAKQAKQPQEGDGNYLQKFGNSFMNVLTSPSDFFMGMLKEKEADERNFAENLGASWRAGTYDVVEGLAGATQWAGDKTNAKWLENAGDSMENFAERGREGYDTVSSDMQGDFQWKDMTDLDFYSQKMFRQAPNMAASVVPALGALRGLQAVNKMKGLKGSVVNYLGAGATNSVFDAGLEAGNTYNIAEDKGIDPNKAANRAFLGNVGLNTGLDAAQFALGFSPLGRLTNKLGRAGSLGAKVTGGAALEGFQEGAQEGIQSSALGEDFSWRSAQTTEAMVLGALMGGTMTGAMGIASDRADARSAVDTDSVLAGIESRLKSKMDDETRTRFEKAKEVAKKNNYSDEDAEDFAYRDLEKNPKGKQALEESIREEVENTRIELERQGVVEKDPRVGYSERFHVGEDVVVDGEEYTVKSMEEGRMELEDDEGFTFVPDTFTVQKKETDPVTQEKETNVLEDSIGLGDEGIRPGMPVTVRNMSGEFQVTDTSDPSLVEVQNAYGTTFKVGRAVIEPVVSEPSFETQSTMGPETLIPDNPTMTEAEALGERPSDTIDQSAAYDPAVMEPPVSPGIAEPMRNQHGVDVSTIQKDSIVELDEDQSRAKVVDVGERDGQQFLYGEQEDGTMIEFPVDAVKRVTVQDFNQMDRDTITPDEMEAIKERVAETGSLDAKTLDEAIGHKKSAGIIKELRDYLTEEGVLDPVVEEIAQQDNRFQAGQEVYYGSKKTPRRAVVEGYDEKGRVLIRKENGSVAPVTESNVFTDEDLQGIEDQKTAPLDQPENFREFMAVAMQAARHQSNDVAKRTINEYATIEIIPEEARTETVVQTLDAIRTERALDMKMMWVRFLNQLVRNNGVDTLQEGFTVEARGNYHVIESYEDVQRIELREDGNTEADAFIKRIEVDRIVSDEAVVDENADTDPVEMEKRKDGQSNVYEVKDRDGTVKAVINSKDVDGNARKLADEAMRKLRNLDKYFQRKEGGKDVEYKVLDVEVSDNGESNYVIQNVKTNVSKVFKDPLNKNVFYDSPVTKPPMKSTGIQGPSIDMQLGDQLKVVMPNGTEYEGEMSGHAGDKVNGVYEFVSVEHEKGKFANGIPSRYIVEHNGLPFDLSDYGVTSQPESSSQPEPSPKPKTDSQPTVDMNVGDRVKVEDMGEGTVSKVRGKKVAGVYPYFDIELDSGETMRNVPAKLMTNYKGTPWDYKEFYANNKEADRAYVDERSNVIEELGEEKVQKWIDSYSKMSDEEITLEVAQHYADSSIREKLREGDRKEAKKMFEKNASNGGVGSKSLSYGEDYQTKKMRIEVGDGRDFLVTKTKLFGAYERYYNNLSPEERQELSDQDEERSASAQSMFDEYKTRDNDGSQKERTPVPEAELNPVYEDSQTMPWQMSKEEFLNNEEWKVRESNTKNAYYVSEPSGDNFPGGQTAHGKTPAKAKEDFHEKQIYWKLRENVSSVSEKAAKSYPDLYKDWKNFRKVKDSINVSETEFTIYVDGEPNTFNIEDYPTNLTGGPANENGYPSGTRGFVAQYELVGDKSKWDEGRWLMNEVVGTAIWQKINDKIRETYQPGTKVLFQADGRKEKVLGEVEGIKSGLIYVNQIPRQNMGIYTLRMDDLELYEGSTQNANTENSDNDTDLDAPRPDRDEERTQKVNKENAEPLEDDSDLVQNRIVGQEYIDSTGGITEYDGNPKGVDSANFFIPVMEDETVIVPERLHYIPEFQRGLVVLDLLLEADGTKTAFRKLVKEGKRNEAKKIVYNQLVMTSLRDGNHVMWVTPEATKAERLKYAYTEGNKKLHTLDLQLQQVVKNYADNIDNISSFYTQTDKQKKVNVAYTDEDMKSMSQEEAPYIVVSLDGEVSTDALKHRSQAVKDGKVDKNDGKYTNKLQAMVFRNNEQNRAYVEELVTDLDPQPTEEGRTGKATTERGTEIEFRYEVVEAKNLIASHTTGMNPNPDFPSDLQPRDRSRKTSLDQVTRMSQKLQPEYLGESPKVSEGAPVVSEDMVVESGNGRTIALQMAYDKSNQSMKKYVQWLNSNQEKFGVKLDGVENPVLVRVRTSDVDRQAFVKEANESGVATMSATERAVSDAEQLTERHLALFEPSEDGNLNRAGNRDFINAFVQDIVPASERNGMYAGNGQLSQEGINRVRNAVFQKAYGNADALAIMSESTDSNVKNIINAMLTLAPKMVSVRERVDQKELHDLNIADELAEAVVKLSDLRNQDTPVKEYLNQTSFMDDTTDLAKDILATLNDAHFSKSAKRINRLFSIYNVELEQYGGPAQMKLDLGNSDIPTKAELYEASLNILAKEDKALDTDTLFQNTEESRGQNNAQPEETSSQQQEEVAEDLPNGTRVKVTTPYGGNTTREWYGVIEDQRTDNGRKTYFVKEELHLATGEVDYDSNKGVRPDQVERAEQQTAESYSYSLLGERVQIMKRVNKDNEDIWSVKVLKKLPKERWKELNDAVRKAGGRYYGAKAPENIRSSWVFKKDPKGNVVDVTTTNREVTNDDVTDEVRDDVRGPSEETLSGTPQGTQGRGDARSDRVRETGESEGESRGTDEPRDVSVGSRGNRSTGGDTAPTGGNYRITDDDNLNIDGKKTTAKRNIDIIKLAKQIQDENRPATVEEQKQLVQFTGWGGLKDALDQDYLVKDDWKPIRNELKELLTEKEFKSAQGSRLNAHFTSKEVISAMYEGLRHFGFSGGRVLEPSMGAGHFVGVMPGDMAKRSKVTGVELDPVTGMIARLLYPDADVRVQGYQDTKIPDNYYDVAIGNVPFGNYEVADPAYDKQKLTKRIHDYFFAKTIDKVREGGLVMFISSKGTMDTETKRVREYLSQKAEFVGAIRLPDTAFKKIADTEVVSDLIILKKLPEGETASNTDWVNTGKMEIDGQSVTVNKHFIDNPDMVLGTPEMSGSMYRGETYTVKGSGNIQEQLQKVLNGLPENVYEKKGQTPLSEKELRERLTVAPEHIKEGSYAVQDGKLFIKREGNLQPSDLEGKRLERVVDMDNVRNHMRELIHAQIEGDDAETKRKALNDAYDAFKKKHGALNQNANKSLFVDDPDANMLMALENWDGKKATKADIFKKNTVSKYEPVQSADSVEDALMVSMSELGYVDLERIASLVGGTVEDSIQKLGDSIFKDPMNDTYVIREEYLSGNVRQKLATAEHAAKTDKSLKRNVEALEKVIPEDVPHTDISVQIGAGWFGENVTQEFVLQHLFGWSAYRAEKARLHYNSATSTWTMEDANSKVKQFNTDRAFTTDWGSQHILNTQLIESILNRKSPKIYDTKQDEFGNKVKTLNKKATFDVREKMDRIRDEFQKWVWEDDARTERIERLYNDTFNAHVLREYDASHMPDTLINMNPDIKLRPHQKNAVYRITQGGNTLLAHAVGAGKTFEMISGMMELKRLGQVNKPMWVVPNHLVEQMARDFLLLYPSANVYVPTEKDFKKDNRKQLFAKIATNNYDAVVVSHTAFGSLSMSTDHVEQFYQEQLDQLDLAIQAEAEAGKRNKARVRSSLERLRKSLEAKMEKKTKRMKKDTDTAYFEELGVDSIVIDEAHEFKNLMYGTKRGNVGGLGNQEGSDKAFDLYMKIRYLQRLNGGKGVVFATGTPISNSIAEMYHMMRYLMTSELESMGFNNFDAWADVFTNIQNVMELAPEGKGFRMKEKVKEIQNFPELATLFRSVADVQTTQTLLNTVDPKTGKTLIEHPKSTREQVIVEPSGELIDYVEELSTRAEAVRSRSVDPEEDNMLKITGDGRKAALDMRTIDPDYPDVENSKINRSKDNIYDVWKKTKKDKGTQLVFIDTNTPGDKGKRKVDDEGNEQFSVYHDLKEKLVEKGIPEKEIAFIHEANTNKRKEKLYKDVRNGTIRVLLGSSQKMGAGMNVQERLKALHHLDVPWRPSDIEQREGRILRQGNKLADSGVELFTYVQEGSFDAYMWQLIEAKAKIINQVMDGDIKARTIEDESELVLSASKMKAIATGDPRIMDYENLKFDVERLENARAAHQDSQRSLKKRLEVELPYLIEKADKDAKEMKPDTKRVKDMSGDNFRMTVGKRTYDSRKEAGEFMYNQIDKLKEKGKKNQANFTPVKVAEISGFDVMFGYKKVITAGTELFQEQLYLKGDGNYVVSIGTPAGTIRSIESKLAKMPEMLENAEARQSHWREEKKKLEALNGKPFEKEQELNDKRKKRDTLAMELNIDEEQDSEEILLDGDDDGDDGISSFVTTAETTERHPTIQRMLDINASGGTDRLVSPKVARQVGHKVAQALNTVLRSGYVEARKSAGTFNFRKGTGNVKANEMSNLRITAHELGHAYELFAGGLQDLDQTELIDVAETLYPDTSNLSKAKVLQEGLAETFQLFLIDPEAAYELSPVNSLKIDTFVTGNRLLSDTIQEVRSIIEHDVEGNPFQRVSGSVVTPNQDRITRDLGTAYKLDEVPADASTVGAAKYRVYGFLKKNVAKYLDFKLPFRDMQRALDQQGYAGPDIIKRMSVAGGSDMKAQHTFQSWATDNAGRYIIHYETKQDLPSFLQPLYDELNAVDNPSRLNDKWGTKKRYRAFYNENKKTMGKAEAKEQAILDAISSRSLQEIAADAVYLVEAHRKIKGTPFEDVLQELNGDKDMDSNNIFSFIVQSYRYRERYERGFKDNPISQKNAERLIDLSKQMFPEMENIVKEYTNNLSEIILEKSLRAGLIDEKAKETILEKSDFYIPTYRAVGKVKVEDGEQERKTTGQPVKRYKGSQEPVLDYLSSSIYKLMEVEQAAEFKTVLDAVEKGLKQKGMGKFGEIVKPSMIPKPVSGAQIEKQLQKMFEDEFDIDASDLEGTISDHVFQTFVKVDMLENGKPILMNWSFDKNGRRRPVYMRVEPDLYHSITSMKPVHTTNALLRAMANVSSVSRYTALATFRYMMNAVSRDTLTAFLQKNTEKNFMKSMMKGMYLATGKDERTVDQYINSGAFASATENVLKSFKRKSITDGLVPTKRPDLWKFKQTNKMLKLVNFSNLLQYQEQIHRYGQWYQMAQEKALEEGLDFQKIMDGRQKLTDEERNKMENILIDLGTEASEVTVNFRGHGTSEWFRKGSTSVTFLHGALQGMYREFLEVQNHMLNGNRKGAAKVLTGRLTKRAMVSLVPITILSWVLTNEYGDEAEDIPTHLRDRYWLFPTPFGYVGVAKPFGYGIPTSYLERFMDDTMGEDDARTFLEDGANPIKENFALPYLPIPAQAVRDLYYNRTWYGAEIVPYWEQNKPKQEQFDNDTSEFAKMVSDKWYQFTNPNADKKLAEGDYDKFKFNGPSPYQIDYFLSNVFGSYGKMGLEMFGGKPMKDTPIIGSMTYGPTEVGSRSVQKFYDRLEKMEKLHSIYGVKGEPNEEVKFTRETSDLLKSLREMEKELPSLGLNKEYEAQLKRQLNQGKKDISRVGIGNEPNDEENLRSVLSMITAYENEQDAKEE